MRKRSIYIIFIFICVNLTLSAQETLTNLEVNPGIKKLYSIQSKNKSKSAKSPIELPFVDDFAKSTGYPDSSLWENKYAFVNFTYPYNPPSIGVATLDAIDETGAIYIDSLLTTFGADTLTSKPINLDYPGNNTIFLSFFYQPGGLGDPPDESDSLILEYYSPDSVEWNQIWCVVFNKEDSVLNEYHKYDVSVKTIHGDSLVDLKLFFQQVIVPVNEDQYLKGNFRFRFRNVASLSLETNFQSTSSNSDHWHLDFVVLNKDRSVNDTIVKDYAFSDPMGTLLKTYNALPWSHFSRALAYEMNDSIKCTYRNLTLTTESPNKNFEIEDIMGSTGTTFIQGGLFGNMSPDSTQTYSISIDYVFPYNTANDSAVFEIRSYLIQDFAPDSIAYQWNDTTRYLQKFYNYYANDDGTAENGYGIVGESTENAMVAMRFNSYKKDTLRGVQMFFNQTYKNTNNYGFKIHVWNDDNGKPGDILLTQEGLRPQNTDSLNQFALYAFEDTLVIEGPFFIGWQKVNTQQMLNIGFDANTINNDKLYYNYAGTWKPSQFNGTVMIRPMFGQEINLPTYSPEKPQNNKLDFKVYPNPANNYLNINIPDEATIHNYRYLVFDAYGRIYADKVVSESSIDISNLNSGIYFIRISNTQKSSTTQKFIIIR